MKTKLFFALIVLLVGFSGCKKEATTGGLIVKVQVAGSSGYQSGADVGLASSQANLDNGVYLQDKVTDGSGKVDFGQLNPGNYYYDCLVTVLGTDYYGEGQVQITAGHNVELTLTVQ